MSAPSPARPSLSGRTLNGRFQILEQLGEGGMGKVYKAIQLPLQRPVAIKVLQPSDGGAIDTQFRQRFIREATLASKLRHPGSVRVLDFGESEGVLFIVMEYLEGMTLAQLLATAGGLPWRSVALIVQGVARALREAHGLGIVHRDLKPSNIMLLGSGDPESVKVLDFGLVKSFIPDEFKGHAPELTTQGMYLGSPAYMAPETARNSADPRSDIYAMGVMMFEMLTGQTPFSGVSFLDVAVQHEVDEVPALATVRPDIQVPARLEQVIRRCLEKLPERRFQSMQQVLDALRPVLESADLRTTMERTGPQVVLSDSGIRAAQAAYPGSDPLRDTGRRPALQTPLPPPQPSTSAPRDRAAIPPPAPAVSQPLMGPLPGEGSSTLFGADSGGSKGGLPTWAIVGVLALAAAGVGGYLLTRHEPAPAAVVSGPAAPGTPASTAPAASVPAAATPPPAPAPTAVHFHVGSDPAGAQVMQGETSLGITPVVFDLPIDPATGEASAEIELRLPGYEPLTLVLGGPGPDVIVKQKLERAVPRAHVTRVRKVVRYVQKARSAEVAVAPVQDATQTPAHATQAAPTPVHAAPAAPVAPAPAPNPAAPATPAAGGATAVPAAPAAPRNVPPFVLDRDKLRRDPVHLSDIYKSTHRGQTVSGMYRVCVGVDGQVTRVDAVTSIAGADQDIEQGIREGWTFQPQKGPVCALYPQTLTIR